jgi:hypothetical protein
MRIGDVTGENDRVWFEAESDAPLAGTVSVQGPTAGAELSGRR